MTLIGQFIIISFIGLIFLLLVVVDIRGQKLHKGDLFQIKIKRRGGRQPLDEVNLQEGKERKGKKTTTQKQTTSRRLPVHLLSNRSK
jgi:hypothetical protein